MKTTSSLYDEQNPALMLAFAVLHDYHFTKKEVIQLARAVVDLNNEQVKLIKHIEELEGKR